MENRNGNQVVRSGLSCWSLAQRVALWLCIVSVVITCAVHGTVWAEASTETSVNANMTSETDKITERTDSYLRAGYSALIPAQNVREILTAGGNAFFVLSVQDAADFKKGHVPGAVNIPFDKLARKSNLAKIPKNKKVIVTCYDGHLSNAAALFLNQIGYDATAMVMGLGAWNKDSVGMGARKPYAGSLEYPVSTETVTPADIISNLPDVKTGRKSVEAMIIARTDSYVSSKRNLVVTPKDIYENTVKSDHPEYFLVSIQKAEDYSKGHVPGAINIPYTEIAKKENLLKLPANKKIAVICYIGHSASSIAMFLNQLGYEAYTMQYGTLGWNEKTEGLGPQKQIMQAAIQSQGFATEGK